MNMQPGAVAEQQPIHQEGFIHRNRRRIAVGTVAILAVGGGVLIGRATEGGADGGGGGRGAATPNVPKDIAEQCDNFVNDHVASNPALYTETAYLPKTENIENQDDTKIYTDNLFDEDGPFAGKGDAASLASINALLVAPSHDGIAATPDFDYLSAFESASAVYTATGQNGLEAARQDCKEAFQTMVQVARYNASWAQKGETITWFAPTFKIVDGQKQIDGMRRQRVVTQGVYRGIELVLNDTVKDLDGFNSILIVTDENGKWDGSYAIKGFTAGQGGNNRSEVKIPTGKAAERIAKAAAAKSAANQGGGGLPHGKGPGCQGTGNGCEGEGPKGTGPGGPGGPGTTEGTTPGTTPNTTPGRTTPKTTPKTVPPTVPPTTPRTTPPTVPPTTLPHKDTPSTLPQPPF